MALEQKGTCTQQEAETCRVRERGIQQIGKHMRKHRTDAADAAPSWDDRETSANVVGTLTLRLLLSLVDFGTCTNL